MLTSRELPVNRENSRNRCESFLNKLVSIPGIAANTCYGLAVKQAIDPIPRAHGGRRGWCSDRD